MGEGVLVLGEGVETVLSAATRILWNGAPLRPAWAARNTDTWRASRSSPASSSLIILVDNHENGAGEEASEACEVRTHTSDTNLSTSAIWSVQIDQVKLGGPLNLTGEIHRFFALAFHHKITTHEPVEASVARRRRQVEGYRDGIRE